MTSPFTRAMAAISNEQGADQHLVPVDAAPLAGAIAKDVARVKAVHEMLVFWESAVRTGVIRGAHVRRAHRIIGRMAQTSLRLAESAEQLYGLTRGGSEPERPGLWWFTQLFKRAP